MISTSLIYKDLSPHLLLEHALKNKEGVLSRSGALAVETGKRTGRSPKDRFIVRDSETENTVNWGPINQPFDKDRFDVLWELVCDYIDTRPHYISHLRVGADPQHFLPVTVITELAWHNLFASHLFMECEVSERQAQEKWTILNAAKFKTDPNRDGVNSDGAVIIDFSKRRILLAGMPYAGEMKKAMFTVMNYLLPPKDILPMHCAANMGKDGDVALFFGLSGTGKTTLSADPERLLIGDDEHGWSPSGIFNFEGGCYAKCINLSQEREPVIWDAIRDGTIMENVILKNNREPDYADDRLTQNTRAAYPRDYIVSRVEENMGGHPEAVIFLTCDLYGVLPPVALLTKEQAAYYFLSGYTALVGSTELGSASGVTPTFSTCFGAPFFPRPPTVYAELLMRRIEETGCSVYLVNTGWTGGAYGEGGERFSIPVTRRIIHAIINGELKNQEMEKIPGFNFVVPQSICGVDQQLLNPRKAWKNKKEYDKCAAILIEKFRDNFKKFTVAESISAAGPHV